MRLWHFSLVIVLCTFISPDLYAGSLCPSYGDDYYSACAAYRDESNGYTTQLEQVNGSYVCFAWREKYTREKAWLSFNVYLYADDCLTNGCLAGTTFNQETQTCESLCSDGQTYHEETGECIDSCPDGQVINSLTDKCVCPDLPSEQQTGVCASSNPCIDGYEIDQQTQACKQKDFNAPCEDNFYECADQCAPFGVGNFTCSSTDGVIDSSACLCAHDNEYGCQNGDVPAFDANGFMGICVPSDINDGGCPDPSYTYGEFNGNVGCHYTDRGDGGGLCANEPERCIDPTNIDDGNTCTSADCGGITDTATGNSTQGTGSGSGSIVNCVDSNGDGFDDSTNIDMATCRSNSGHTSSPSDVDLSTLEQLQQQTTNAVNKGNSNLDAMNTNLSQTNDKLDIANRTLNDIKEELAKEELVLNPHTAKAEGKTFSSVIDEHYERLKNAPLIAPLSNISFPNADGVCIPLSFDLGAWGSHSTSIHCELYRQVSPALGVVMLFVWSLLGIRILFR
ncbi:MAG: hypothetical protein CR991_02095 [Proteobacteria bacterium]|nr:MAG: hypothetical protein CR991_02095 [Pseudomonadota bacterium]